MVRRKAARILVQVFAKYPVCGQVKTRLYPILGRQEATRFHAALVRQCVRKLCCLPASFHIELWSDQPADRRFNLELLSINPRLRPRLQKGDDLGQRMNFAMRSGLRLYEKVVLIGTDCPYLDLVHIIQVCQNTDHEHLDLIAAMDGGYVLLALSTHHEALFRGISWGSDSVLRQTLTAARRLGWSIKVHGFIPDLDTPGDYIFWRAANRLHLPKAD